MKARIHIFLKPSVFDPQGNTVTQSLKRIGFSQIKEIRLGKVVDIEIETSMLDEAKREIKKMCEKLLVNPVLESYEWEILNS